VLHTEIQALLIVIKLCWQAGLRKVICYFDSLHVVKLVTMRTHQYHHYVNVVEIIRDYMKKDRNVILKHTLSEENACSDILAKMKANCVDSLILVNESFPNPSSALIANIRRVSFIRTSFLFLFFFSHVKKKKNLKN
jgi:hypothetical protein